MTLWDTRQGCTAGEDKPKGRDVDRCNSHNRRDGVRVLFYQANTRQPEMGQGSPEFLPPVIVQAATPCPYSAVVVGTAEFGRLGVSG